MYFMASARVPESLHHLELMFVYDMRESSTFKDKTEDSLTFYSPEFLVLFILLIKHPGNEVLALLSPVVDSVAILNSLC